jgi:hypothetical protein
MLLLMLPLLLPVLPAAAAAAAAATASVGLAPLTDLQHLALAGLDTKQSLPSSTDWFPVSGCIFSQLVKLTHLELDKVAASSTLEHLAQLTSLERLLLGRLSLHNASVISLSGLERLNRLRWLRIEGLDANISTSSLPSLGQLTGLTKLQLLNCKGFQPILLSGMMDLVELDLQGTSLLGTGGVVDVPAAAAAAAVMQVQIAAANGAGAAAGAGGNGGALRGCSDCSHYVFSQDGVYLSLHTSSLMHRPLFVLPVLSLVSKGVTSSTCPCQFIPY